MDGGMEGGREEGREEGGNGGSEGMDGWLEKRETCSRGESAEEILRCWATGGGPVGNL